MSVWTASAKTTALAPGDKLAVLDAEDIASGAATRAFTLTPLESGGGVLLTLLNQTSEAMALQCSADNVTYEPVYAAGAAVSCPEAEALAVLVSTGLYYRLAPAGDVTAGTVWVAR